MVRLIFKFLFFSVVVIAQPDGFIKEGNNTDASFIHFSPEHYICYKTNEVIMIDGKMNEPVWNKVDWTPCFVDIEGALKPLPYLQTRAKMLWDNDYFYFLAELIEPHVCATLTEHDSYIFWEDRDFEIFIDPDGSTHNYFEFEQNAFGTYWDLFLDKPYRNNGTALHSWDYEGMMTKVHVNGTVNDPSDLDTSWVTEVAIPWSNFSLGNDVNLPPGAGDQWRVNFSRVQWEVEIDSVNNTYKKIGSFGDEHNWVWSPQGVIDMHLPEMWGFVQFSDLVAGSGMDEFVWNRIEDAKWALRQLYYKQVMYKQNHGTYTNNIAELGLPDFKIEGYNWPPEIVSNDSSYTAFMTDIAKTHTVYIEQDSRAWVD